MTGASLGAARSLAAIALTGALALGAGPTSAVRVDTWAELPVGPLDLSGQWRRYPEEPTAFKHPPALVRDDDRAALQLMTDGEAMRIGRALKLDVKKTPWLSWEWKPLVFPEGGDVRHPKKNDQTGRVSVIFEGMKAILYVWDTTAPVGAEARSDGLELFQRVLIVVRSGPQGVGQWTTERRNVYEDYRRVFEEAPRAVKWVGLETHSNDTNTRTSILFGHVRFEAR